MKMYRSTEIHTNELQLTDSQIAFLNKKKQKEKSLHMGAAISFLLIFVLLNWFLVFIAIQPGALDQILNPLLISMMCLMEVFLGYIVFLFAKRALAFPLQEGTELIKIHGIIQKGIFSTPMNNGRLIEMPVYSISGFLLDIPVQWQAHLSFRPAYTLTIYPEFKYYSLLERLFQLPTHRGIVLAIKTNDGSQNLSV